MISNGMNFMSRYNRILQLEKEIDMRFVELERLYYDGISEQSSAKLRNKVESDGNSHYVISRRPK